jgi:hypothetical protein
MQTENAFIDYVNAAERILDIRYGLTLAEARIDLDDLVEAQAHGLTPAMFINSLPRTSDLEPFDCW